MTIKNKEFDLLVEIWKFLSAEGSRPDMAAALLNALNRMNKGREKAYARTHRPAEPPEQVKQRLRKEDKPLMQMLAEAGCPAGDMDHHGTDLYVYVTPVSTKVVELWCRRHGYDRTWFCPTFFDQVTGRLMYDCVFQYLPEWGAGIHDN